MCAAIEAGLADGCPTALSRTLANWQSRQCARNLDLAMAWHEKAARNGQLDSQRIYGQMLRERQRHDEAVTWLRTAAERGDRAAQNDLGIMYIKGWGVPQSRVDAIAWLLRAYRQGSATAKDSLRKLGVDALTARLDTPEFMRIDEPDVDRALR